MIRKTLKVLLLCLCGLSALAQREDYVWFFGDSLIMDFGIVPPLVTKSALVHSREASSCISDGAGNLLFYSNCEEIFNRDHVPMMGSAGVFTPDGNSTITNGTLILPIFGVPDKYWHLRIIGPFGPGELRLTQVDMTLDGGRGGIGSIIDSLLYSFPGHAEKLTAIRHANGRDWWVLGQGYGDNQFVSFRLGADTLYGPFVQNIGQLVVWINFTASSGEIVASEKGDRLVCIGANGIVDLFSFDRCTGELSGWIPIETGSSFSTSRALYGASFSSSGRFLYVSELQDVGGQELFQYDLEAADIPASRIRIWTSSALHRIGQHELGPDGKIYLAHLHDNYPWPVSDSLNQFLSVIHFPDSIGVSCGFQPFAISLAPSRSSGGLPNFPNYNLGPILPDQLANAGPDREGCPAALHTLGTPDTTGGACLYSWSPTTGLSDPASPTPTASPAQTTTYVLTVTQPGKSACAISHDTVTVNVIECPPQFPNVFSPNGDGINDVFMVRDLPAGTQLSVYDRWGHLVWQTEDYANDWSGQSLQGSMCPEGVYFWQAYPPVYKAQAGHVTLVR